MRSRTGSISAVLAGVVSFAIADLVRLGLSLAGARPGIGADDAAVTHHHGPKLRTAATMEASRCFKVVAATSDAQLGCKGRKGKFTIFYGRSSLCDFSAACLMARAQFMLRPHHGA
jgi:hypothetical protein